MRPNEELYDEVQKLKIGDYAKTFDSKPEYYGKVIKVDKFFINDKQYTYKYKLEFNDKKTGNFLSNDLKKVTDINRKNLRPNQDFGKYRSPIKESNMKTSDRLLEKLKALSRGEYLRDKWKEKGEMEDWEVENEKRKALKNPTPNDLKMPSRKVISNEWDREKIEQGRIERRKRNQETEPQRKAYQEMLKQKYEKVPTRERFFRESTLLDRLNDMFIKEDETQVGTLETPIQSTGSTPEPVKNVEPEKKEDEPKKEEPKESEHDKKFKEQLKAIMKKVKENQTVEWKNLIDLLETFEKTDLNKE